MIPLSLYLEVFLLQSVVKPGTPYYFMSALEGTNPNIISCTWGYSMLRGRHADSPHTAAEAGQYPDALISILTCSCPSRSSLKLAGR